MPDRPPSLDDIGKAPASLPVPHVPLPPVSPLEELRARFDQVAEENFNLKTDNHALTQKLNTKDKVNSILGPYSNKVFWFLCAYGLGCFTLLMLNGFHYEGFVLSDALLQVVVGSTAVSAIGLVALVIRGIFGLVGNN